MLYPWVIMRMSVQRHSVINDILREYLHDMSNGCLACFFGLAAVAVIQLWAKERRAAMWSATFSIVAILVWLGEVPFP